MEEQANKSQEMDLGGEETNASAPLPEEKLVEESELEKLKAELESYKDKYIRTIAEFDNFKRRNAKERIELMQTAGRDVITAVLELASPPVYCSLIVFSWFCSIHVVWEMADKGGEAEVMNFLISHQVVPVAFEAKTAQ